MRYEDTIPSPVGPVRYRAHGAVYHICVYDTYILYEKDSQIKSIAEFMCMGMLW